jgi:hypothetical protein
MLSHEQQRHDRCDRRKYDAERDAFQAQVSLESPSMSPTESLSAVADERLMRF